MKQTKLFLSLLMLVVFGIGNVWGEEVVFDKCGTTLSNTTNTSVSTVKFTGTGDGAGEYTFNYLQGKKLGDAIFLSKDKGAFISNKTPMPGIIQSVKVFINSGAAKATTYHCAFSTTECTSAYTTGSTAVNIAAGSSNTFQCTIKDAKFFCISLGNSNNGQVLKIVVTYTSGSSTEPSLGVDKTEIDFGTVEQGAAVAAQTVAVTMANVETVLAGFETSCTAFIVSPEELSANGNLTITPNTSVAVGEYTSTLTITDLDKLSKEVSVKMNVVKPFDGKIWEINATNFDKPQSGSGYEPYNGEHTLNGISYESVSVMLQNSSLQFKKSDGYIYNTTNMGVITKIEITTPSDKSNNLTVYFGNAQNPSKGNVNGTVDGAVTTYVAPDNCGFFKLKNGSTITNITSIKVYYHTVTSLAITVDENAKGKVTVDKKSAMPGEIVTLSAIPNKHYKFNGWRVYDADMNEYEVDAENNTFKMPSVPVHVDATFADCDKYTVIISANKAEYGTAVFDGFTEDTKEIYVDDYYTITATPTTDYRFVDWTADPKANIDFADAKAQTTQFRVLGDAIIYANFEPIPIQTPATITLWENGVESSSKLNGSVGEAVTLPMTAGGNCNKSVEFVGWSEVEIANSASEPTANFYAPGAAYTIQQESTTLYAVYAKSLKQVLLSENFSELTTGNLDNQGKQWNGNANFTANTAYPAGGVVKLGGKSSTGSLKSKVLTIAAGNTINVSFDVLGWTTVEGDIKVTVAGAGNQTVTYKATKSDEFESKSVDFVLTKDNPTITIETTDKRAFIDNVVVSAKGHSDYSTTCAEVVEVAMPTFSVAGGEYSEAQSVEIRCTTDGATIYYTLDGTEPTHASKQYTGAINVDKSMTVKAIAYVGTDNYSDVAVAEYVVLQDAEVKWQTYGEDGSSKVDLTEATIYTDDDLDLFVYTPSNGKQTFTSTDENVAIVEEKTGLGGLKYIALAVKGAGMTKITVNVESDGTFAAGGASFVLHVVEHKTIVNMSFPAESYNATLGEEFTAPALTVSPSVAPVVYSSSDENVAKADATTGEITLVGMGTTTITAIYDGDETHDPATAQYILNVTDPNADILTIDMMNTSNSYKDFTCTGSATGTSYAGCNMKSSGGYIQIRSSSSNSTYTGIISMVSKGFIKSVSITFAEANTNGIDIYANLTPYEKVSDLYNGATRGVKLTSLKGQTDETVTFAPVENYPYIGIRSNSGAAHIKQIAIAWTPTEVVRKGLTEGKFGTICLEKNVTTSLGASFYEIAYREDQNGEPYKVNFDEVTELEAGVPYIFLAEDEQITVVYGDEAATTAGSRNGLVGTFEVIQDGAAGTAGNTLEGNYLVNNNQIRKCLGNCSLPANRAYIRMDDVTTNAVAPQPGRRRVTLQNAATGTATGWEGITEDSTVAPQQEGIYDVLGRKLESAESGFYIINGKKQVIAK